MHDDSQNSHDTESLTPAEARVLGSLLEKEVTTPENYPLSLNALTNACNQKSNRQPLMLIEETVVREAADTLRERKMVMMFHGAEARVPKFKQTLNNVYNLEQAELAVICELLLRGPQTTGELRTRCERLKASLNLEAMEKVLLSLIEYPIQPLVAKLPRQSGQKEQRYAQLLTGEPPAPAEADESSSPAHSPSSRDIREANSARLQSLEEEVSHLRQEISELKNTFDQFRQQFE